MKPALRITEILSMAQTVFAGVLELLVKHQPNVPIMASVELMDFAVVLEEDVSPLVIIIATVTLRSLVSHNFGVVGNLMAWMLPTEHAVNAQSEPSR